MLTGMEKYNDLALFQSSAQRGHAGLEIPTGLAAATSSGSTTTARTAPAPAVEDHVAKAPIEDASETSVLDENVSNSPDDTPTLKRRVVAKKIMWTRATEEALLDTLIECIRRGWRTNGIFNKDAWNAATRAVTNAAAPNYAAAVTRSRVAQKYQNWRNLWRYWKTMTSNNNGWAMNDRGLPYNSSSAVMESYFLEHPPARKLCQRPLPYAEDMDLIFGDNGDKLSSSNADMPTSRKRLSDIDATPLDRQDANKPSPSMSTGQVIAQGPTATRSKQFEHPANSNNTTPAAKRSKADNRISKMLDLSSPATDSSLSRHTHDVLQTRRDPIEAAADVFWSRFTDEFPDEALVIAAKALESVNTAQMFLRAPERLQGVLVRRYMQEGGVTEAGMDRSRLR